MKALLLKQYMELEVVDTPKPTIQADEILVRVKACGICGSDVHGIDGSTGRRIPPLVMGHEAAGVVVEVGSGVERFREGDRVTFDSTIYCGHCYFCRQGRPNLCDNRRVLGVSIEEYRRHGAFAEYVSVPQHIVYALPDASLSIRRVKGTGVKRGRRVKIRDWGRVKGTLFNIFKLHLEKPSALWECSGHPKGREQGREMMILNNVPSILTSPLS